MEKVWEELKKIDAQAEQIRSEAQTDAKEIAILAQKETEALLLSSKTYAQQETETFYEGAILEANRTRQDQLKANRQTTENLSKQAQKRMDTAASAIVAEVLGVT
jgi:hypothetical protein